MNRQIVRIMQTLLVAIFVMMSAIMPTFAQPAMAQSTPTQMQPSTELKEVRVFLQSGWSALGRHAVADYFVITCPNYEVLDPEHPCSESNEGKFSQVDDLVLVCPIKEVLDPSHPCAE